MHVVVDRLFAPGRVLLVQSGVLQLHELSLDQVCDDGREEFCDFGVSYSCQSHGSAAKEEVTGQDGHFVAKGDVCAGVAAAGYGGVDHVVVEERGSVDELCDFGQTSLRGQYVLVRAVLRGVRLLASQWRVRIGIREHRRVGDGLVDSFCSSRSSFFG